MPPIPPFRGTISTTIDFRVVMNKFLLDFSAWLDSLSPTSVGGKAVVFLGTTMGLVNNPLLRPAICHGGTLQGGRLTGHDILESQ